METQSVFQVGTWTIHEGPHVWNILHGNSISVPSWHLDNSRRASCMEHPSWKLNQCSKLAPGQFIKDPPGVFVHVYIVHIPLVGPRQQASSYDLRVKSLTHILPVLGCENKTKIKVKGTLSKDTS